MTFDVTTEEAQLIVGALETLPHRTVNRLIVKLQRQAEPQLKPPTQDAATPPKPTRKGK